MVSWNKQEGCDRYYHVFVEGELEELISSLDKVSFVDSTYDYGNWTVVLKKHSYN